MPLRHLPDGPDPENPPSFFYVTVIDAGRIGVLAGPYDTHAEAVTAKPIAQQRAIAANPWAHFYAFGTAGSDDVLKAVFGKMEKPSHVARSEKRRAGQLALGI